MLEALRNLLREVSAVIATLKNLPGNSPVTGVISERSQELVLTWSVSLRPGLAAIRVPKEVLIRADRFTSRVARLAATNPSRTEWLAALTAVRRVLLEQVLLEVAKIPPAILATVAVPSPSPLFPEISDLPDQLVPYAVQGWSDRIKRFLNRKPFGSNVFIMVSYRARLAPLIGSVKAELLGLKLNPVLAREQSLTDDLYNPIACLLCCSYGVAIFDRAETGQMHNPNVVYELGMMQLLRRPSVILKHHRLRSMPTDLLSKLYETYSSQAEAVERLREWWGRINQQ